jgi:hypothetical protein
MVFMKSRGSVIRSYTVASCSWMTVVFAKRQLSESARIRVTFCLNPVSIIRSGSGS